MTGIFTEPIVGDDLLSREEHVDEGAHVADSEFAVTVGISGSRGHLVLGNDAVELVPIVGY